MWKIDNYRQKVSRILIAFLWLLAPLSAAVAICLNGPWVTISAAAVGVALTATAFWRFADKSPASRVMIAVALIGEISLLLGASAGGAWQVDVHMAYFAAVALIAVYCDPVAIAVATAAVALHHLTLNVLLPNAIYPGGSDFGRAILHAVILLIEAGGLMWMSSMISAAAENSANASHYADEALIAAQAAARQAESARESERHEAQEKQSLQDRVAAEQGETAAILADRLSKVADGDLTARISEELSGQYAQMRSDFNAAIGKLAGAIGAVSDRTSSVRAGAGRFAETAESLSSRSEQQATRLSETVSALDRISDLIKRATNQAFGARDVVSAADSDAKRSGEIVGKAIEAMEAITQSSSRIGQIIGVIDEIAFQTNLLALNAGVEAARAGESGRGFAVVASEVRALAQRSAQAAKEIKELISASMNQVQAGADLVTGAGDALDRIVRKVSEINGVVGEIANAAKEQLASVSDIHQALNEMDSSTRENVDMAKEASRASRDLAEESEDLGNLMRQFKIGSASSMTASSRAERRPQAPAKVAKPARRKAANDDWSEF